MYSKMKNGRISTAGKYKSQVTDEAGKITTPKCFKPMCHCMKSVRTDTQSLQVLKISSLFNLNTDVGNAGFFEECCYLCHRSTPQWFT